MDGELWEHLSNADRALGRLDGSTDALPNPNLFVLMYIRKEAVLSSQIEGTQASLIDVLEFEADALDPENPTDVEEVINYVAAMNMGLSRLETLPVSLRLIREIHERLLRGVRGAEKSPGEFRTSQNWIGPVGSTLNTATYIPPPPQEVLRCMGQLEDFIHDDLIRMPVLMRVGLAHAQLETIHPFLDGNGRVGRLLVTFLLCEKDVLKRPLLYLSHYFKQHRETYYQRLQAVRDKGDWEGWLKFFLTGIAEVSNEAAETSHRIVRLREEHRGLIANRFGRMTATGITLLEAMYERPIIQIKTAASITGTAYINANRLVHRMIEHGLLREISGRQRNRRYSYGQYLDLFTDDSEAN